MLMNVHFALVEFWQKCKYDSILRMKDFIANLLNNFRYAIKIFI